MHMSASITSTSSAGSGARPSAPKRRLDRIIQRSQTCSPRHDTEKRLVALLWGEKGHYAIDSSPTAVSREQSLSANTDDFEDDEGATTVPDEDIADRDAAVSYRGCGNKCGCADEVSFFFEFFFFLWLFFSSGWRYVCIFFPGWWMGNQKSDSPFPLQVQKLRAENERLLRILEASGMIKSTE